MTSASYTIKTETAQQVVQGNQNQVVFGNDFHGATVNLVEHEPVAPRRWPPPLHVRPPRFATMLDREEPVARLLKALHASVPVEIDLSTTFV